ncbi:SAYSvFN domain-containing protein 1 [Echeneis naucrates]|uniref:SAYSvFN domain-containing protein n=1 Tax=Echeneis naucrates TaxID=173247 RepID=A0A665W9K3_ECHNA|nr:SAYSvFN domain-containing protein 1 [Echeneis naucrates]
MSMERKLAEFRARRVAENAAKKEQEAHPELRQPTVAAHPTIAPPTTPRPHTDNNPAETLSPPIRGRNDWLLDNALGRWLASRHIIISNLFLLKVLLWLVLLGLFVELEFGLPFFVISLFYWLYEGLRSPAARQPGELSAYSVFNPDCQPLLGALTAEQLEGEMGYRPLANR